MRKLFGLLFVLSLLLLPGQRALAQQSSPAAGSSLLTDLGYPDLVISTDGSTMDAPTELAAGRYHLVVQNSGDLSAGVSFGQVPEDMTYDDLVTTLKNQDPQAQQPPEILYKMVLAGGSIAAPGSTAEAIITLAPGDWLIDVNASDPNSEGPGTDIFQELSVSGDLPELTDPEAGVVVDMVELAFDMPDTIPAGPQIWQVNNKGSFLHFMVLQSYPEPVTAEQIQATLSTMIGAPATPSASPVTLLDPSLSTTLGETAILSAGQTNWIELDLQPGQYEVFCFMSGPGEVPMHAAAGMFKVITVE